MEILAPVTDRDYHGGLGCVVLLLSLVSAVVSNVK